ncbi:dihydrofolate synthase/folylpolyglutamate synthase [Entomoplasma freundtii]|uniref:Folylpolyglutamate synthase n=1 Tax=Entomoplasma freundtii TaxID=74700 RepID=A0A2K8NV87_9MOLU|nr:Mur ligase family protein [Entomoplasma freundtii]ATZ16661.1 folylpolyglutamate synthase [Entomoplasma freundtii]TDY58172.1 dihydrofolate synthase/folylpolyglutamate synthase [Entomoplasma freundtii]
MYKVSKELIPINRRFAKEYNLAKALNDLGNPQLTIPTINVVGTNGKGSVASGLAKGLEQKYKRVGLFISPAFLYHNERIQINGDFIDDEELTNLINSSKPLIDKYNLTFFEIWTLIMIRYFAHKKVDIAVIEAGIGGLKDATKVMTNQQLVLLTAVDYDHLNVLGSTIEEIMVQKIGIAYSGTTIIASADNRNRSDLIEKMVRKNNLKLIWASERDDQVHYQKANKGLILCALEWLGCANSDSLTFQWPKGRFTILQRKPLWVLDGAHNPNGISQLIKTIEKTMHNPLILYAASAEKEYEQIVNLLEKTFHKENVFLTSFDHLKAWDINLVNQTNSHQIVDWKEFLLVHNQSEREIIICGSLYFVPQVYEWFITNSKNKKQEDYDLLLN